MLMIFWIERSSVVWLTRKWLLEVKSVSAGRYRNNNGLLARNEMKDPKFPSVCVVDRKRSRKASYRKLKYFLLLFEWSSPPPQF